MARLKVRNLKGTAKRKCKCRTWKEHWYNHGGHRNTTKCSTEGCNGDFEHGGHVVKANSSDKNHYIVPLCNACNQKSESEVFIVNADFISANKSATCA